jgi:AAA domain
LNNVVPLNRDVIFREDGTVFDSTTGEIRPLHETKADQSAPTDTVALSPNVTDINEMLHALFGPSFAQANPEAWIEIAFGRPGYPLQEAQNYGVFELEYVAKFAQAKNKDGYNIYIAPAARAGKQPRSGRSNREHVCTAAYAWVEFDDDGDAIRIQEILKANSLVPALVVTTGTVPHIRAHLYFRLDGTVTPDQLEAANVALRDLLGTDDVQNADRIMRLAGTVSYPSPDKKGRGYVDELTTLRIVKEAPAYKVERLIALAPQLESDPYTAYAEGNSTKPGRNDEELMKLLKSINGKDGGNEKWRNPMIKAVATLVGRGDSNSTIKLICAPYCNDGYDDPDLQKLIDDQRKDFDKPDPGDGPVQREKSLVLPAGPLIVNSAGFLAGFVPPDYLIDGILQRGFCYSATAPTGTGKTAVALGLAAHVAMGMSLDKIDVEKGRVLYLAGENPDDIRMRWIACADKLGFDPDTIEVCFLPGVFKISQIYSRIATEVEKIGPVALVIVDTSAAYFEGDDENANVQMGNHARRLRSLVNLPGRPCVLVPCHPVKNATADNMVPKGGGSFLNEVDGNLTLAKTDSTVTLHWQGKFRGPDFAPLSFQLHTVTTDKLVDSKGRPIPSVVATPMSDEERGQADANSRRDEDLVLVTVYGGNRRSLTDIALLLNWTTKQGKPNKSKVNRVMDRLKKAKLVQAERGGAYAVTPKGEKEANRVRES